MRSLLLLASFALGSLSCSDDDPAPPSDAAAIDVVAPDAVGFDCDAYCECMDESCAGSFDDRPMCIATCEGLDPSVQDCRLEHCGLASLPDGAATHCPHANGIGLCEG